MKLSKLKMPMKRKELDLSSLDEGSPEEEASESPDEEAAEAPEKEHAEMEMGTEEESHNPQLDDVSDEELMAELKKRGLMSKLEEGGDDKELDQSMYT